MDLRPLAMAAGLLMLVALALAGAVLLGESARVPPPRREPAVVVARAEPPIIAQRTQPDARGMSRPLAPAFPGAAATTDLPAPPVAEAPPPAAPAPVVAQEPPAEVPRPHRTLRAAPPSDQDGPPADQPPADPAPADVGQGRRHPHRTLRAAPSPDQNQRQAELMPPSAEPPPPRPPAVDHRYDGVLTMSEIARLKRSLRLSADQEPYWPPIASLLREVGRRQMAQVDAGQRPTFDLPGDLSARLYSAAMPLLGTLREDQKVVVRQHARSLGLGSVASFI